jgi:hypothetical protein
MREENLDRQLDAALSRYAAVEPRYGLEQRVLANLRVKREAGRGRWRPAVVLATAMAFAVILLGWRVTHYRTRMASVVSPAQRIAPPSARLGRLQTNAKQADQPGKRLRAYSEARRGARRTGNKQAGAGLPELAQFPLPEPLTGQEKLLLQFVKDNPGEAALVAQARTEALQREADEWKAFALKMDSQQGER